MFVRVLLRRFTILRKSVLNVTFSPDGQQLLIPSKRKQANVQGLNIETLQSVIISPKSGYFFNPLVSSTGDYLACVESEPNKNILHIRSQVDDTEKMIPVFATPLLRTWSPDERQIVYEALYQKAICRVDLESGHIDTLDRFDEPVWEPISYSFDGSRLVYPLMKEGKRHLVVLDVETKKKQMIRSTQGYLSSACWMPDNRSLVYSEMTGKHAKLIRHDLKDGAETILHSDSLLITKLCLSPDVQSVAFVVKNPKSNKGRI